MDFNLLKSKLANSITQRSTITSWNNFPLTILKLSLRDISAALNGADFLCHVY